MSHGSIVVMKDFANSLPGGWREDSQAALSILIKDIRDPVAKKRRLLVRPWICTKDLKDILQSLTTIPSIRQRLFYNGKELRSSHTLLESGIFKDGSTILFSISSKINGSTPTINPYGSSRFPPSLMKTLYQAEQGLMLGYAPELAMDGTGGTYFLRNSSHKVVGCFKPQDEEPFASNNPRGFVGELGQPGLRPGILSGEACEREVAAYMLDKNFAHVPATGFVEATHPVFNYGGKKQTLKLGSLQEFVQHDDVASDVSPNLFKTEDVHRIVILDIRLLNTDRNDANILVRKRRYRLSNSQEKGKPGTPSSSGYHIEYQLTPIDHGYCLPDRFEVAWCDLCWYSWPQLKEPLSDSCRKYISTMNPEEDAKLVMNSLSIRPECLRNMLIVGTFLKKSVNAGLLLYTIVRIICREDLDEPSILENLINLANIKSLQSCQKSSQANATLSYDISHQSSKYHSNTITPINDAETISFESLTINVSNDLNDPNGTHNQANGGVRSPLGFWASYTPFNDSKFLEQVTLDYEETCPNITDETDVSKSNSLDVKDSSDTFSNGSNQEKDDTSISITYKNWNDKCYFTILNTLLDEEISKQLILQNKTLMN